MLRFLVLLFCVSQIHGFWHHTRCTSADECDNDECCMVHKKWNGDVTRKGYCAKRPGPGAFCNSDNHVEDDDGVYVRSCPCKDGFQCRTPHHHHRPTHPHPTGRPTRPHHPTGRPTGPHHPTGWPTRPHHPTGGRPTGTPTWGPPTRTWGPTGSRGPTPTWGPTRTWGPTGSRGPTPTWGPPTRTWGPTGSRGPSPTWGPTGTGSWGPTRTWGPTGSWGPTRTWGPTGSWGPTRTWGPTGSDGPTPSWEPSRPTVRPSNRPTMGPYTTTPEPFPPVSEDVVDEDEFDIEQESIENQKCWKGEFCLPE